MAIEKWGLVWFPCTVASVTPYTSPAHKLDDCVVMLYAYTEA